MLAYTAFLIRPTSVLLQIARKLQVFYHQCLLLHRKSIEKYHKCQTKTWMQYSIALFHFSFGVPQSMIKEWFFNIYSWCSNFRIITDVTQVHGNKITVVLSIYMCTMYCINMVQTGAITSIISYNNIHISPRILKNQTSLWKVSCQVPQCSAASFGHVVDTLFFNNWIVRPIW